MILHYELEQKKRTTAGQSAPGRGCSLAAAVQAGADQAARDNERQADVQVQVADALVPVSGAYLSAAVAELVDNACHFSRPGQPVRVASEVTPGRCAVTVTDAGPGMSPTQRESVAPFAQFDRQRTEQQGLGLGLGIVRSVAELAGGRLVLTAPSSGSGLLARLELPTLPDD